MHHHLRQPIAPLAAHSLYLHPGIGIAGIEFAQFRFHIFLEIIVRTPGRLPPSLIRGESPETTGDEREGE
jgi:hypothetical protein